MIIQQDFSKHQFYDSGQAMKTFHRYRYRHLKTVLSTSVFQTEIVLLSPFNYL